MNENEDHWENFQISFISFNEDEICINGQLLQLFCRLEAATCYSL